MAIPNFWKIKFTNCTGLVEGIQLLTIPYFVHELFGYAHINKDFPITIKHNFGMTRSARKRSSNVTHICHIDF